ncbi:MAG: HD domain-containing protein [Candidatus Micrarchaeia archaeon]
MLAHARFSSRQQPSNWSRWFFDGSLRKRLIKARVSRALTALEAEARSLTSLEELVDWVSGHFMRKTTLGERWLHKPAHSREVAKLALAITLSMARAGHAEDELAPDIMLVSGFVHDVGKLPIPTRILRKEERKPLWSKRLTEWERELLRQHLDFSVAIINATRVPERELIVRNVSAHHERFDGDTMSKFAGYPAGLSGERIPLGGRILKVADAFSAMVHHRFYRNTIFTPEDVIAHMIELAGREFDPNVVKALINAIYAIPGDVLDKLMARAGKRFDATPRGVLLRAMPGMSDDFMEMAREYALPAGHPNKIISTLSDELAWQFIHKLDIAYDADAIAEFAKWINPNNRTRWRALESVLAEQHEEHARRALAIYRRLHLENIRIEQHVSV